MFRPNKHQKIKREAILQAVEYRHFTKLRFVNLLILGISILIVLATSIFMYERIYSTIGQIQIINLSKNQLGSEIIDFKTLEETEIAWQAKYSTSTLPIGRDPFNAIVVESPEEVIEEIEEQ